MKIKCYKWQMKRALQWYNNQLALKFAGRLMSPRFQYEAQAVLKQLQEHMQHRENNPIWTVPVHIEFDFNQNLMNVVVTDENQVLYYDFDSP